MIDPASGPFLFDTSAESWLGRADLPWVVQWMRDYVSRHEVHISAVTVMERVRGYSLLWRRASEDGRVRIETARIAYLTNLGRVWPLNDAVAVVAGEIMALLMILYPLTRWPIEGFRGDEPALFAGMTLSQNISLGLLVGGIAAWILLKPTAFTQSSC